MDDLIVKNMKKSIPLIFAILFVVAAVYVVWMVYGKPQNKKQGKFGDFIKLAKRANCADKTNSLFVIDNKYVFLVREGDCPDNSYSYTLFGSTFKEELCSTSDSIEGPRTLCKDKSLKPMFETITHNLGASDLGLGASHKVQKILVK